jgi:hypothetical protein
MRSARVDVNNGVLSIASPAGAHAAGSYTLQVNWRYGISSGWVIETLGIIPFAVSRAIAATD